MDTFPFIALIGISNEINKAQRVATTLGGIFIPVIYSGRSTYSQ